MLKIDQARAQYDIRSILGLDGSKRKIVCPLPTHRHHENTPSFSIFDRDGVQLWKCHGSCNTEGDVVDLVGYLRVPGYNKRDPSHVIRALSLIEERWEPGVVVHEKEVRLVGDEWRHFQPMTAEVLEYAQKRGLIYETVVKFRLGSWQQFMTMPNFEEGKLMGIKLRRIEAGEPRFFSLKGSRLGLFNFDAVNLAMKPVLIVKGEIPCMLLDQLGFLACAPTGGEGSWYKNERWKVALALAPKIIVGDNDEAGRKLGSRRSELLGGKLVFPPEQWKDIDAWILADREGAMTQISHWIAEAAL